MTIAAEAMVELHDRATGWLRDDRSWLLHVVTSAELRKGTLRTLRGLELSALAPGPVVQLEAPHDLGVPGWDARADTLRRAYGARRGQAGNDESWPELGPVPSQGGLAGFAEQLGAILAATSGGRPWVVVLAPVFVKALPQWARAIAMLRRGSALGSVRWIVVDVERSSLGELGTDDEIERINVEASGGGMDEAAAVVGVAADAAPRAPGAQSGAARPPRRRKAASPAEDPERRLRLELGQHVVAASSSLRKGDHAKAVEQQRRARDLCTDAGWSEQQVTMELLLGGYLLAASVPHQAELSHRRAIEQARSVKGRPDLLPLSQIALGSTRMSRGDRPAAMLAYSEAVVSAEPLGAAPLMLEACRLAGDTALLLGLDAQAIAFWGRAVTLAQGSPGVAGLGSAGYSASALALLCEKRGLGERAREYWDAARQLDGVDLQAVRELAEAPAEAPAREITEPRPTPPDASVALKDPAAGDPAQRVEQAEVASSTPTIAFATEPSPVAASGKTLPLEEHSVDPRLGEEGTAQVSIEELAALHWQGVLPKAPPSEVVHRWSGVEEDTIRRAVSIVLSANTTSLMTREEVLAIHGKAALPAARETTPEATAMLELASVLAKQRATEPEAEGTSWISQEELAAVRARFGQPGATEEAVESHAAPDAVVVSTEPVVSRVAGPGFGQDASSGDATAIMTKEQILEIARKHAAKRTTRSEEP